MLGSILNTVNGGPEDAGLDSLPVSPQHEHHDVLD